VVNTVSLLFDKSNQNHPFARDLKNEPMTRLPEVFPVKLVWMVSSSYPSPIVVGSRVSPPFNDVVSNFLKFAMGSTLSVVLKFCDVLLRIRESGKTCDSHLAY
jgi:hypothetical protein